MSESKKLWGGRFQGATDPGFARYNRSFGFDRRLFEADVRASTAHCDSLRAAGVRAAALEREHSSHTVRSCPRRGFSRGIRRRFLRVRAAPTGVG